MQAYLDGVQSSASEFCPSASEDGTSSDEDATVSARRDAYTSIKPNGKIWTILVY